MHIQFRAVSLQRRTRTSYMAIIGAHLRCVSGRSIIVPLRLIPFMYVQQLLSGVKIVISLSLLTVDSSHPYRLELSTHPLEPHPLLIPQPWSCLLIPWSLIVYSSLNLGAVYSSLGASWSQATHPSTLELSTLPLELHCLLTPPSSLELSTLLLEPHCLLIPHPFSLLVLWSLLLCSHLWRPV